MRGTIVGWAAFVAAVVVLVPAIVIGGSALLMDQLQQRDSAGESDEPYAQAAPDSPTDPAPHAERAEDEDQGAGGAEDAEGPAASAARASEVLSAASDAELDQALAEAVEGRPGRYSVSVAELSGEGRRAEHSAEDPVDPASTYKLYVAYSALKQVEEDELQWEQSIVDGRDLDQCFYDMLAVSDNACAEALLNDVVGREQIVEDLPEVGALSTSFEIGDVRTTASDLTGMLARWEAGELPVQQQDGDALMGAMAENIHRDGIPAGVSGDVSDKVGFRGPYLHDAAIVHDDAGAWVLTILTEGSSWDEIAEISGEVEAALDR